VQYLATGCRFPRRPVLQREHSIAAGTLATRWSRWASSRASSWSPSARAEAEAHPRLISGVVSWSALVRWDSQTVRKASVGETFAARIAGSSPAMPPIAIAAAIPPAHASAGMTVDQPLAEA
jgi:hypothetical protein